jgi:hypothetical protein
LSSFGALDGVGIDDQLAGFVLIDIAPSSSACLTVGQSRQTTLYDGSLPQDDDIDSLMGMPVDLRQGA